MENGAPEYPASKNAIPLESDLFPIEAWTSKFLKRLEVLIPKYNGSGGADLASFQETSNEQQFLDFSH